MNENHADFPRLAGRRNEFLKAIEKLQITEEVKNNAINYVDNFILTGKHNPFFVELAMKGFPKSEIGISMAVFTLMELFVQFFYLTSRKESPPLPFLLVYGGLIISLSLAFLIAHQTQNYIIPKDLPFFKPVNICSTENSEVWEVKKLITDFFGIYNKNREDSLKIINESENSDSYDDLIKKIM